MGSLLRPDAAALNKADDLALVELASYVVQHAEAPIDLPVLPEGPAVGLWDFAEQFIVGSPARAYSPAAPVG